MEYRFEELCLEAPGHPELVIGTLDPIVVRWDCAHEWDAVLTEGVTSITIEATRWPDGRPPITVPIDIMRPGKVSAHPNADLVTLIVAQEITHRIENDESWYNRMHEEWQAARTLDRECAAINAAWNARKEARLSLVHSNA